MSFVRPELRALAWRWREVLVALAVAAFGTWISFATAGWLVPTLGTLLALAALGFAWAAHQRMRFANPIAAPGVVVVDERRVGYFAPEGGGFIETGELTSVALLPGAVWHLSDTAGLSLEIPVAAKGAQGLFDVFEALPGFPMERALSSIESPPDAIVPLWKTD